MRQWQYPCFPVAATTRHPINRRRALLPRSRKRPGGVESEASVEPEESADPITLEFWTISLSPTFDDYFNARFDAYTADHPNVTIKWVDMPQDAINDKLSTSAAAGNAPDVVNLNTSQALTMVGLDALVDLNAEATEEQKSIYIPGQWEACKTGDSIWAFPWYGTPAVLAYNTELLEMAGIETPPSTYEEALGMAEDFYNKTGSYLFMPNAYCNMLFLDDMDIISDDLTEVTWNNDENKALLLRYKELVDKGVLPKEGWGDWTTCLQLYETEKLGMISASAVSVNRVSDEAPDVAAKTEVAKPLVGKAGLSTNPLMNVVVPKASKHVKEAIDFANYITNDESQLLFCKEVAIFPSTTKASEDEFFKSDMDTLLGRATAMAAESNLYSADFTIGLTNGSEYISAINNAASAVITNDEDIEEIFATYEGDCKTLLEEAGAN